MPNNAIPPSARTAATLVERRLGVAVEMIERFQSGLANYVYDVRLVDGRRLVARLAHGPDAQATTRAAVYWNRLLRPRGVPLPQLLGWELRPPAGAPYLLLERLPGRELGEVFPTLTRAQQRALAGRIVDIQRAVGQLPDGPGYGFASSYRATDLLPSWAAVLRAELARAREWITGAGVVDVAHVARVEACLPAFAAYCATIAPRPFLDDTTTKNVIIHDGQLSGIVDVDCLCFGDPLYTVALTRMALLSRGWETAYIDDWLELLAVDAAQRAALELYTAIFCVNFLGELGQAFNRDAPAPVNEAHVARLLRVLDSTLAQVNLYHHDEFT
jgi:aminoglycoside phosphotransferase (APT) family kinase protein